MAATGLLLFIVLLIAPLSTLGAVGDVKRGSYLATAGGCMGCHTDARQGAPPYAGGRTLKTPFGVFFGPNITPHREAGIGGWTEEEFVNAMRLGIRPDGAHYYPAFPYPSFTKITDQDLRDLWAYLRTVPPSDRVSQPHDLRFPFGWRWLMWGWKLLFFEPGPFVPNPSSPAVLNRGRYLVNALGHCGECHTPRNWLGGPKKEWFLAGGERAVGGRAPNLTPTRLGKLSDAELEEILKTGLTPDGDSLSESMAEVVENTTSQLTAQDLAALIAYLRSLPPLPDEPK